MKEPRALLGLAGPFDENWEKVRWLQMAPLSRLALTRLVIHVMAVMAVLGIYHQAVPLPMLAGWAMLAGGLAAFNLRVDHGLTEVERARITRADFRRYTRSAVAATAVWALMMFIFPPYGEGADHLALWCVVALLIATAALWFSTAPLSALIFIAGAGFASVVSFALSGNYMIGVIALVYTCIAMAGAMKVARISLASRQAEADMAEKSEVVSLLLREFEESEADWLWEIDKTRRVRGASPRFAFALASSREEAEGLPLLQLISGDAWHTGQFDPSLHELADRLKHKESFSNLIVRVTIRGQHKWWELSGTPKYDETGKFDGFRGVGSDVTEARESSEKIAWLARYDTLTGLPNRLMLMEALAEAMRYAEKWRTHCAFLMIDLDRFKAINDSLGHQIGDKLLARVSERLKSIVTDNETCGRLGGDEFAIVIRDASDRSYVDKVARMVIEQLSQPYNVEHHTLYVGSSVGSAFGPRDGFTVEELMRNADLALYRAKDEGGGVHCVFQPALHAEAEERRQLEFSLRNALQDNEFELHYQPVVDANSEEIVSFEALLRWHSPKHGTVSPAKFVPLAEDTRLIVPIGEWVLQEACIEAAKWPTSIRVAVNVSGEQLLDPYFSMTVANALNTAGLDPSRLEIEVTESIFVRDAITARATLEKIMAQGCSVALDDFGTGYSSLGYLRKLSFSTIKVDRSFVQGAAQKSAESLAIIRAVVAMADSLGMATTAEGVETSAEAAMVRKLGCTKIQGYHFGRPVSAPDARQLLSRPTVRKRA